MRLPLPSRKQPAVTRISAFYVEMWSFRPAHSFQACDDAGEIVVREGERQRRTYEAIQPLREPASREVLTFAVLRADSLQGHP
jgi:hypothetical protein